MPRLTDYVLFFALLLIALIALPMLFPMSKAPKTQANITDKTLNKTIITQNQTGNLSQNTTVARPPPKIGIPKINLSNKTASVIPPPPFYDLVRMEKNIHDLVNEERIAKGRSPLAFNPDLASVAREHSINLAKENEPLTDPSIYCHQILIHHEGFDFGLYEYDRLHNRSIYYFSGAGENIFMISSWGYIEGQVPEGTPECESGLGTAEEYKGPDAAEQVKEDLEELEDYAETAARVNWTYVEWMDQSEIEQAVVAGWMDSPGHRQNILDRAFDEEGIGVAKVNDFIVVTEVFVDRVDCGYLDAQCCVDKIGIYCYAPWNCDGAICS
jgi:uncharacterized protein YkwD